MVERFESVWLGKSDLYVQRNAQWAREAQAQLRAKRYLAVCELEMKPEWEREEGP